MFTGTRRQSDLQSLPLQNAVFCLDCETISNVSRDECPVCKCRSLVSLARILGGNLFRRGHEHLEDNQVLFDATITVELAEIKPKDLNDTIDQLTRLMGSTLARGGANFHVDVKPLAEESAAAEGEAA